MKLPLLPPFLCRLVPCLLVGAAHAADAPPSSDPAKPFLLFMGTDIELQVAGDSQRVVDVNGDSFIIFANRRKIEVPMNRGPVAMKVVPGLKLTDQLATVDDLKIERAYTPQNDPYKKWAAQQTGAAGQSAAGTAAGRMGSAMMGQQAAAQRGAALGGPSGALSGGDNGVGAALSSFQDAQMNVGSDMNNGGYVAGQLQAELDRQLFDAILVTFAVSAPKALEDPYLVVVTHYREKDKPGSTKSWVFAKALERLDSRPLEVRVLQGGFPAGFELVRHEAHLYGNGRELGTNVAAKGVALSRDEAHEYLVLDHLALHPGKTVPPDVALGVPALRLNTRYTPDQQRELVYVKVTPEGLPDGAYRDEECTRPCDDNYLASLVADVRFKPALKEGKATAGVAKLKLSALAL